MVKILIKMEWYFKHPVDLLYQNHSFCAAEGIGLKMKETS